MSYAMIPAHAVVTACKKYITAFDERVKREREEYLANLIGTKDWFWSKPKTREDIEAEHCSELQWIRLTGGYWRAEVVDLLSLAEIAAKHNSMIQVSTKLSKTLSEYFE